MMFSKAKRFDEKPVGCGADSTYDVKTVEKPIGGVIPRTDRFVEPKPPASVHSDTESVHSDKSSQVFRTPKSVRKLVVSSLTKKAKECTKKQSETEILKEQLNEAKVEIGSKNATIAENDIEIHHMKKSVFELEKKLHVLSEILTTCTKCSVEHEKIYKKINSDISNDNKESELTETELYLQRIVALLSENESLRHDLAYMKKSGEDSENKLKEQLQILNEEVFELENELKEFNLNISYDDDDEPLCKKLKALRNVFRKQHNELDAINLSLMNAEKEILDLKDENKEQLHKISLIKDLQEKIKSLESQISEMNDYDEKRSIDVLALSDLVNTKDVICKDLTQKLDDRITQIEELNENFALIKQHHALALEANESIRHEYKMEMDMAKLKFEEEFTFIQKQYKLDLETLNKEHSEKIEKMQNEHSSVIKSLKDTFSLKVANLEEHSSEKIRICEIQFEERLQELQLHHESCFQKEKELWMSQIKDLQCALDENQSQTNKFSRTIMIYDEEIEKLTDNLRNIESLRKNEHAAYENEIYQLKTNMDYINNELKKYSVTLETSMHTVDVLKNRLRNSDEEVETLRTELDSMTMLKKSFEEKFIAENEAFLNFKVEYNNLLMSIIDSKNHLDKSHNEILQRNDEIIEIIKTIENESKEEIEGLKILLLNDLDAYKCIAIGQIKEMESKMNKKQELLIELKNDCQKAHEVIDDCQTMIYNAEYQLEAKDQEISELATEKDKIAGTLAALEEEKNELEVLLKEFAILAKEKDSKIHNLMKKMEIQEEMINEFECDNRRKNEALSSALSLAESKSQEITKLSEQIEELHSKVSEVDQLQEWKSKFENLDADHEKISNIYDELMIKYDSLQEDVYKLEYCIKCKDDQNEDLQDINSTLKQEILSLKSHINSCNREDLESRCLNLQSELAEVTTKYTDLLGHHNNKQKIKHVNDLKLQNSNLKEENEKFTLTIQKQSALIEKLKKDLKEASSMKSPCAARKQLLLVGKENITSPVNKSPIRLGSPNVFVLKELNR